MQIKDRPEFSNKPAPVVLAATDYVSVAVQVMTKRNIGSVIIVDEARKVKGIVTERDLLRRLLGSHMDQDTTRLSEIMTSEVRTARQDDEIIDWLRQMSNERFRHLPVVDEEGRLINVMSQGDFVSYTWPELLGSLRAKAGEAMRSGSAPIPILIGAMMLYTLAMILIFKAF
ncbi:CBS domain-containing protein [Lichenicoccus sp.]|uniref:CBS domain-containing protein n=1 Tax=Lichenicoccus sp. TaxID=2781899 RepID=UPI003D1397B9